jgi:hypothetical protein
MANTALKSLFKTDIVEIIRDFLSGSSNYYLFVGRSLPYEDNPSTTAVESDTRPPSFGEVGRNTYDSIRNGIFIKRIFPENMKLVVPRIDWTPGTLYTAYSETTDLEDEEWYVFTSENDVYKCMKSSGNPSTIMPTGRSTQVFSLSDGYSWKYIYTVPEDYLGHITLDYIPVFLAGDENLEQRAVQDSAVPGSIDSVSFNPTAGPTFDKSFRYDRLFTSFNTVADLGVTANQAGSTVVTINIGDEAINPANGYWNDYAIRVTDGPGIGQYLRIVNFAKTGSGVSYHYAEIHPPLDRPVSTLSQYRIVPYMVVDGDGTGAVVAPVTDSDRKIDSLTILNSGRNYTYARPRVVTGASGPSIGTAVATLNDTISASLSTPKGHGYNAIRELKPASLMMVVEVDGTEDGKISHRNDYRQFGILKSPLLQGGETLAGEEEQRILEVLVKKQPTKTDKYSLNTFVPGMFVFGKESRATARIIDSDRFVPSRSSMLRLYLTDIEGDFRFSEDSSSKVRVYYGATYSAPFATGDIARQYSSVVGQTLSARGTIFSYDLYDRSVVIDTLQGAFAKDRLISFGTAGYTMEAAAILDVDQEYGESIGQVAIGSTGGSSFMSFGGDEVFGRIASTSFTSSIAEDIGRYDLTTKITVVSGTPFTDGVLFGVPAVDGTLSQTDPKTLVRTKADILDFTVQGGSGLTGILRVNNVKGKFNITDSLSFTEYGLTAEQQMTVTISGITLPDISVGSGELLYIENIRPIQRNQEQSEEFKIVIGF